MKLIQLLMGGLILLSLGCGPSSLWNWEKDIKIDDFSPTGIVSTGENEFWVSDTDHNKLLKINEAGDVLHQIEELERPMHIAIDQNKIYVPEYGSDSILIINNGKIVSNLSIPELPDAPASVDVKGDLIMVADFYNHRIIYESKAVNKSFGKKGKANGEFHYPTDVQFFKDNIYVADAYNHRIQVFNLEGDHLQTIGSDQKMNATTGIFVDENYIIATDFENDRVLSFDHAGALLYIIEEGLFGPTDVLIKDKKLYVLNFKGGFISIYQM